MTVEDLIKQVPALAVLGVDFTLNIAAAVLVVAVGWTLSRWAARLIRRTLAGSARVEPTLVPVVTEVARYLILITTLVAMLDRFGIQTTSIITALGAAGLALGLALQGTLSNVAAGFMLLLLRPLKIGDEVEVAGQAGIVEEIGLFTTSLVSFDGIWRSLPNSAVWGTPIVNYSRLPNRLINLVVTLNHDDDIDRAMALIRSTLAADPRILAQPEPLVVVDALKVATIDLLVRGWTRRGDFGLARWDLQKTLKARLAEAGLAIPHPQVVINRREDAAAV